MVTLYDENTKDKIQGNLEGYDKRNKEFTGYIKVPGYVGTGDYKLTSVHITDSDGEWIQYLKTNPDPGSPKFGELKENIKVTVGESISNILGETGFSLTELSILQKKGFIGEGVSVNTKYNWDYSVKIQIKSVLVSFVKKVLIRLNLLQSNLNLIWEKQIL
jgi:hypothetical protein